MDGIVHGVTKSRTRLSDFRFQTKGSFPGGTMVKNLPADAGDAGDLGLIHGLGRSPGEGKRLPTPAFWPGELHGLYSPWGCKE